MLSRPSACCASRQWARGPLGARSCLLGARSHLPSPAPPHIAAPRMELLPHAPRALSSSNCRSTSALPPSTAGQRRRGEGAGRGVGRMSKGHPQAAGACPQCPAQTPTFLMHSTATAQHSTARTRVGIKRLLQPPRLLALRCCRPVMVARTWSATAHARAGANRSAGSNRLLGQDRMGRPRVGQPARHTPLPHPRCSAPSRSQTSAVASRGRLSACSLSGPAADASASASGRPCSAASGSCASAGLACRGGGAVCGADWRVSGGGTFPRMLGTPWHCACQTRMLPAHAGRSTFPHTQQSRRTFFSGAPVVGQGRLILRPQPHVCSLMLLVESVVGLGREESTGEAARGGRGWRQGCTAPWVAQRQQQQQQRVQAQPHREPGRAGG